ncbi:MAG: hypothetical protein WAM73_00185 [Desulfobacterales bacterium]
MLDPVRKGFIFEISNQCIAVKNLVIVCLVSFCEMIGGLAQVLLDVLKLGNLMKYIPHPSPQAVSGLQDLQTGGSDNK